MLKLNIKLLIDSPPKLTVAHLSLSVDRDRRLWRGWTLRAPLVHRSLSGCGFIYRWLPVSAGLRQLHSAARSTTCTTRRKPHLRPFCGCGIEAVKQP